MHISTRKYLEDIREAEERGYQKGRKDAFEEDLMTKREVSIQGNINRLEGYIEEMKMRLEQNRREKVLKETGVSCVTCNTEEPKAADV